MIASSVQWKLLGMAQGAARAGGYRVSLDTLRTMEALLRQPNRGLASADRGIMLLVQVMIAEAMKQDADNKVIQEDAPRSASSVPSGP